MGSVYERSELVAGVTAEYLALTCQGEVVCEG
jgi:hypothetical protein